MPTGSDVRWTASGRALERSYYDGADLAALAAAWEELAPAFPPAHPNGVALALCLTAASSAAGRWGVSRPCRRWLLETFTEVYGPAAHEVSQARRLVGLPAPTSYPCAGLLSLEGLPGVGKTALLLGLCPSVAVAPEPHHALVRSEGATEDPPRALILGEGLRGGLRRGLMESSALRQLAYGVAVGTTRDDWSIYRRSCATASGLDARGRLPLPGTVLLVTLDEAQRRTRLESRVPHRGVPACGAEWSDAKFQAGWEMGLVRVAERLGVEVLRGSAAEEVALDAASRAAPRLPPGRLAALPATAQAAADAFG